MEVDMANKRQKTSDAIEIVESVEKELYKKVRAYIAAARAKVYTVANEEMVKAYWNVGREIVEKQGGGGRSVYGDGLVDRLAIKLTAEFGPGYTRVNLFYMRRFYLAFPKVHTLCKQLSWSHYRTLITVLRLELQRERAAIEEAMALRALPPPEAGKPPVPRKASKGGK
jgi:hypothetical protein